MSTKGGSTLTADIWSRYGVVPNSDYLGMSSISARRPDGFIEVEPTLQVRGQATVFALGDLSTADAKMAGAARRQAATVAANITSLASGNDELESYVVEGPGHRRADRTGRRGGSVPGSGRDRGARGDCRPEGTGSDGRALRRAVRPRRSPAANDRLPIWATALDVPSRDRRIGLPVRPGDRRRRRDSPGPTGQAACLGRGFAGAGSFGGFRNSGSVRSNMSNRLLALASRRVRAGRFHFSSTVLRIEVWS